ncbi:signal transduction histidine kinase [Mucilaginibacter frigoritolerans]|uniref:histidine kinase n=1 Tax=Mucilaginibacter frigoritolerans TaxID=652788 RepID=A0A562UGP6_9SPHI|nr:response regulator [Mucilaginibacter frigoritolerans]TWJ04557.1 signal transduction histidine kinase [Mucilaginibacter frigoritolerans]
MSREVNFFNFSISKILSKDQSILDQARIRLLYYGFWIVAVATAGLFINVYFQHQVLLSITAGILFVSVAVLFKYLTYKPQWRPISHALLVIATLINLNNVFIALQNVDIITVQIILLIILFSFYMLGQTWGLVYTLLNLIPVLAFMVMEYNTSYFIALRPEKVDQSTIIISIFANFIIIVYIHSHFYGAFFNNIKQLKETGEEQLRLNAQLELAIDKAEKSSQVKSEFLATMSHEIRTPLNAIIGMSNLMIMANPRPDQRENLNVLKFSSNNLLAIVNDVLDFNKIESGKVVFENTKFNIIELMQNICGAEILKAEQKGLTFTLKIDPQLQNKVLFGDPTRVSQILFNLISNAIKFTQKGNIWVKTSLYEDKHNTVIINFVVKDTGIGIEKSNLESIFEPFTQESITTTRQYGGTGLGLAIVKRLLELQGLNMNVTSKVGEGSEFSFNMEFPVSTEKMKPSGEKYSLLQNNEVLNSLRVLIAEDNPVNVLLMKKLLSKWNILPMIAENGERAIEILQYGNFDIILMDLQMPVMNGFDAAREIRRLPDPKKASIPIIALTAAALNDIREQVLNAGMNDYVSKPFKPEDLMEKIHGLVVAVHS